VPALQQDLPELVAQLLIHEQFVVTQVQLVLVPLAQQVQEQVQLVQVQVQLELEPPPVVALLELVELPCLRKNFGAQKKLAQKKLMQRENLAYLF
jgi:hypothetical protein